ncbi:MAG: asparaginase [Nannocystales bacterium]
MSRVCVLHVGGTIGMAASPDGLVPQREVLDRYLASMPELQRPDVPKHHVELLEPLLDSADMAPADWLRIAKAIVARDAEFDGFVVLHGTDTMTHTASALSFLLQGLRKPVILTGAQLSLEHVRTDGREHIVTSIILAGTTKIPEVCIYFADRLLRGNRAQKVHNTDFVAFDSGNLRPLATVGARIKVADHLIRKPGGGLPISLKFERAPQVVALRVFPGLSRVLLDTVLEGADGVVLETYGAGTFPHRGGALLESIRRATSATKPTVVVNVSQCHGGVVDQATYASSRALADSGVVSGVDMTPEAALTKLYCLFAAGHAPDAVRRMVGEDLAGELDPTAVSDV